jgi:phosphate starvation-inducible protein PhoH
MSHKKRTAKAAPVKVPVSKKMEVKDNSPYVFQRDKINVSLSVKDLPWTEKQKNIIQLFLDKGTKALFLKGPAGTGKAQPLDADILTPTGYVKMVDIKPGDFVFARNGKSTRVVSIHPQGLKEIYKVTFSDGTSTECTEDHLWLTKTYYDRTFSKTKETVRQSRIKRGLSELKHSQKREDSAMNGTVKTLKEIKDTLYVGNSENINHTIPITDPVQFDSVEHIIHPYIMGVLLGDGCLRTHVNLTCADTGILEQIKQFLPENIHLKYKNVQYSYAFIGEKQNNIFLNEVRRLNLAGKYSHNKHIPNEYLFDSPDNRLWLLKGLMDSDGFVITKQGNVGFCSTSKELMNGVRFLVESLGGLCSEGSVCEETHYVYKNELCKGRKSYTFYINIPVNPFNLERKRNLVQERTKYFPTRYITNVELVSQKEAQCILIEDEEHLYLTNNCIVTHNTLLAMYCGLTLLNNKRVSDLVLVRAAVESADSKLGYLPGTQEEKLSPHHLAFQDKLSELLIKPHIAALVKDERLTSCPINFARGLHFAAKFVCVDEYQNLTRKESLLMLSRIGEYSKVFLCGDPEQSDLPYGKSSFVETYNLFNNEESRAQGIFCVELNEDDIVRSEFCKFITKKFRELPPLQHNSKH